MASCILITPSPLINTTERIGSALVVDEAGAIVGIVTAVDACRTFARFLENQGL